MWPHEPDEFDAAHIPPDDADHGEAWYFVFSRGELIVKSVQGAHAACDIGRTQLRRLDERTDPQLVHAKLFGPSA